MAHPAAMGRSPDTTDSGRASDPLRRANRGPAARQHFDRIASRYQRAVETWQPIYAQTAQRLAPLIAGRDILDIGNGGVFAYDPARARQVTVVDISPAMLEDIRGPNVTTVIDDARRLGRIAPGSVDVVLFMLLLHHINGRSARETLEILEQVLTAARRRLRPGGHLVVIEPVVRPWLYGVQARAYPVTAWLLRRLGVPMIFFYTAAILRAHLGRCLGSATSEVETFPITVEQRVDPLGASFPGLISVPPWMRPTDYCFFQARDTR
jgi:SAM-dependent methyltransferase